ncbi:hypothetical protein [Microcella sp.]|uniref:hypothetical protein n=1 Tax=Microcella sp. TaxID=1913979 RepID=UPI00391C8BED
MTLTVTAPGTTVVSGTVLESMCVQLRAQADRCAFAERLARSAYGPGLDSYALAQLDQAVVATRNAVQRLEALASALTSVADLMIGADHAAQRGIEAAASQAAALLGLIGSRVALIGGVMLLPAALQAARVAQLLPEHLRAAAATTLGAAAGRGLNLVGQRLATPEGVELARWLVSLLDDAALGAAGAPPALVPLIGEPGLGITGVTSSAAVLTGLAAVIGIRGTAPARVERVSVVGGVPTPAPSTLERRTPPPQSISDRVVRIPDSSGPQVRVERYEGPTGPRFEVYIAGTNPTAEAGGTNPFDMASNGALVAGQPDATSVQAVELALRDAGATASSPVVFTGHSQGAAVATVHAESGTWNTAGLITIGGPLGNFPVTGDYPAIVIEHDDDIITAASGLRRETSATVVTTRALPDGASDLFLPHAATSYHGTAALVDASDDPALVAARQRFPTTSGIGAVRHYEATRILDAE